MTLRLVVRACGARAAWLVSRWLLRACALGWDLAPRARTIRHRLQGKRRGERTCSTWVHRIRDSLCRTGFAFTWFAMRDDDKTLRGGLKALPMLLSSVRS